jgi:hypothetical protein
MKVTVNRQEYEAHELENLVVHHDLSPEEAARRLEQDYPSGTDAVQKELRFRGLDATDWRIQAYADRRIKEKDPLRVIGKTRVWYRSDVDALANELEAKHSLTPEAQWRESRKITWAEEERRKEEGRLKIEQDLSERIGCTRFKFQAALYQELQNKMAEQHGFIKRTSPAVDGSAVWYNWTTADIEAARKFISDSKQDANFLKDVQRLQAIDARREAYREGTL